MAIAWEPFMAHVQERGEYTTTGEAERVTRAVLSAPDAHLLGSERTELADRLPAQCQPLLLEPLPATKPLSPHEFVEAVALLIKSATPRGIGTYIAFPALSRCWVCECLMARRGVVGEVAGGWPGRAAVPSAGPACG
ncbi:DUF2267 domain-containing protein [Streptomyces hirsutus]|uniref:DUF2267 domain-containing protein n=1 Tax=Streptomyces hirsutus TaxID=35620 RepID=UPI003685FCE8